MSTQKEDVELRTILQDSHKIKQKKLKHSHTKKKSLNNRNEYKRSSGIEFKHIFKRT